jgi:hypothetical protein
LLPVERSRFDRGARLFELVAERLEVGVDRLLQQALLLGVEGFAAGGKLQPLEHRHLVRELVDGGLLVAQLNLLRAHRGQWLLCQRAQLRFAQLVDVRAVDHGAHGAAPMIV